MTPESIPIDFNETMTLMKERKTESMKKINNNNDKTDKENTNKNKRKKSA